LLFRPFVGRRWIELSVVCLFLGGGTSTAAFQWGFSIFPVDIHFSEILFRLRLFIAQRLSLIILAGALSLVLMLALLYVRCVLRFVLVETVIKREVALRPAWKSLQPLGRAYFLWLLAVLGTVLVMAMGVIIGSFPYLRSARAAGHPNWLSSLLLVTALTAVVLVGLLVAVAITLTDDLVVPLIYAERISLPKAWAKVWRVARRDSGMFMFYVVLRLAASIYIGAAVLLFLLPVLMGLSSGAVVAMALAILALRLIGLAWTWNPATLVLDTVALLVLSGFLFALLSVVGMPGLVYLQNYGVRFIASRAPALEALCCSSTASGRRR
jgi:hypothetical protein